jgi:hypothetical protein
MELGKKAAVEGNGDIGAPHFEIEVELCEDEICII